LERSDKRFRIAGKDEGGPMSRTRLAIILACGFLAALSASAFAEQDKPTIGVSTAVDFVKAIGPNRTIILSKGDYVLSTAYSVKNRHARWDVSDSGYELAIADLDGLTIRGEPGARIVVDSPSAYALDFYNCSSVELDSVAFVREAGDAEVSAGGIYAEEVEGFRLDHVSFEGQNGYPIELQYCGSVTLEALSVSGGFYGGLFASHSKDILVKDTGFSGNDGSPFISLEETTRVTFSGCRFVGNNGGTFVDIYADAVKPEGIVFASSLFSGNQFEYFTGPDYLPVTDSCTFEGNSFGADWATAAVAPPADEEYYPADRGELADYAFDDLGLMLSYPFTWQVQEGEKDSRVGFFSEDGAASVIFTALPGKLPSSPTKAQLESAFAAAASDLVDLIQKEVGLAIAYTDKASPAVDDSGLTSATCSGRGKPEKGGGKTVKVRFVLSEGRVYALAAFVDDADLLAPGSEADGILASLAPLGRD
jgi:hypothetical protein